MNTCLAILVIFAILVSRFPAESLIFTSEKERTPKNKIHKINIIMSNITIPETLVVLLEPAEPVPEVNPPGYAKIPATITIKNIKNPIPLKSPIFVNPLNNPPADASAPGKPVALDPCIVGRVISVTK